jgi:hypothetical protein
MVSTTAKRLICTGSAAVLAFSTLLAIGLDNHHPPALGTALAGNGNGNGHSGGNGGGHGDSNGNGNDNSGGNGNGRGDDSSGGNGNRGQDIGNDRSNGGRDIIFFLKPRVKGSALGALNASHASARALAHASPNSEVGKIAAYKQALMTVLTNDQAALAAYEADLKTDPQCTGAPCQSAQAQVTTDLATVDSDLKAAANKPITTAVVTAVDTNLGLSVDPAIEAAIATGANH